MSRPKAHQKRRKEAALRRKAEAEARGEVILSKRARKARDRKMKHEQAEKEAGAAGEIGLEAERKDAIKGEVMEFYFAEGDTDQNMATDKKELDAEEGKNPLSKFMESFFGGEAKAEIRLVCRIAPAEVKGKDVLPDMERKARRRAQKLKQTLKKAGAVAKEADGNGEMMDTGCTDGDADLNMDMVASFDSVPFFATGAAASNTTHTMAQTEATQADKREVKDGDYAIASIAEPAPFNTFTSAGQQFTFALRPKSGGGGA